MIGSFYESIFPYGDISNPEFEAKVFEAYDKILEQIPNLTTQGFQDEDHYMAEWLYHNRTSYTRVKGLTIEAIAYTIYNIRKHNYHC